MNGSLTPCVIDGKQLDQEIYAETRGTEVSLLFIARDGRKNRDYATALRRALDIAADLGGLLVAATVESRVALEQHPDAQERAIDGEHLRYPVVLAGTDLDRVRAELTNGQREIATSGTRKGGGAWKRVAFVFDFDNADAAAELTRSMATGAPVAATVTVPEATGTVGLPEGARRIEIVNRYERNPANRRACVQHFGAVCGVCDFDFEVTYGAIGEGFIHVHHLTPLSQLGSGYVIDPIADLRPVCANCHAMLHRRAPAPYSIDELRDIMEATGATPTAL